MASIDDTRSSLKPIYEAKPDMRYGTTFLSNKYRDYAVKGETLQDKVTGEIFTKRIEDGRVVSFYQNKKYIYDLMLELRIQMVNNLEFRMPPGDSKEIIYLSTDYDVMSIFDNKEKDIVEDDIVIPNVVIHNTDGTDSHVKEVKFKISKETNGFFTRVSTRDSDRTVIEWASDQYNIIVEDYVGPNEIINDEKVKFSTIENWDEYNALITYTLKYTKYGDVIESVFTRGVRVNELTCVPFPHGFNIDEEFETTEYVEITINKIEFTKLHFILNNIDLRPNLAVEFEKFSYPDRKILSNYISVVCFKDLTSDVTLLGNEFIIALLDLQYVSKYMSKLQNIMSPGSVLITTERPDETIWPAKTIWLERIRDVGEDGEEEYMDSETDLKLLEDYLSDQVTIDFTTASNDPNNLHAMLIEEV